MSDLADMLLDWLRFDLERIALRRNNELAYFGCLLILVCEELA